MGRDCLDDLHESVSLRQLLRIRFAKLEAQCFFLRQIDRERNDIRISDGWLQKLPVSGTVLNLGSEEDADALSFGNLERDLWQ